MLETIQANLYDYPKYYDLVYGSDWKAEFDFLLACFEKHSHATVRRVYEPACGTGRLLIKLAAAGYEVGGVDLNPLAVDYCNKRLQRGSYPPTAVVGDMCNFRTAAPVDAMFNTINSFRLLGTEDQAKRHLQCVAHSLRPGGLYILGLHLTPTTVEPLQEESWAARRGNLAVLSKLWVTNLDLKQRCETVGMSFDVYTPTKQFRIEDQARFRTYTSNQLQMLLDEAKSFEISSVYDFGYDIHRSIEVGPESEDVLYVLRKCG